MSKRDELWHVEEDYHSKDRKASRKERKRISNKDRSKFKKSDQDQLKKQSLLNPSSETDSLKKGRVLAILPEGIVVSCGPLEYLCSLKGSLKQS
jgi:ribosome biogenesis GTPase